MNKDLQKQLVGTIFSLNNISKFRYEQIQYESHLSKLFRSLYNLLNKKKFWNIFL